jgi:hypothetical protein
MGDEILYFYNTLLNWDTTALLAVNGMGKTIPNEELS